MKILIIGPIPNSFGGKYMGGIATHIEGLATNLVNNDNKVSIWYHKPIPYFKKNEIEIIQNNVFNILSSIFVIPLILLKNYKSFLSIEENLLLSFQIFRLKDIIESNTFDVIHVHSLHNTSSIAINIIDSSMPIIITDHGFWQKRGAMIEGSRVFLKIRNTADNCSKLIYISEYALNMHNQIDYGQKGKLIKISNPIVISSNIIEEKLPKQKKTIFFNGLTKSLEIKQFDLLLESINANIFLKENVDIIAIADEKGRQYVNRNKFDFNIELYSSVSKEKVTEFYKRSDVLVLPSKSESFGLVYLEALSHGIPIVGFKDVLLEFKNNIGEYIGEYYSYKDDDINSLGVKIEKALKSKFSANTVQEKVLIKYSFKYRVSDYIELYKSL